MKSYFTEEIANKEMAKKSYFTEEIANKKDVSTYDIPAYKGEEVTRDFLLKKKPYYQYLPFGEKLASKIYTPEIAKKMAEVDPYEGKETDRLWLLPKKALFDLTPFAENVFSKIYNPKVAKALADIKPETAHEQRVFSGLSEPEQKPWEEQSFEELLEQETEFWKSPGKYGDMPIRTPFAIIAGAGMDVRRFAEGIRKDEFRWLDKPTEALGFANMPTKMMKTAGKPGFLGASLVKHYFPGEYEQLGKMIEPQPSETLLGHAREFAKTGMRFMLPKPEELEKQVKHILGIELMTEEREGQVIPYGRALAAEAVEFTDPTMWIRWHIAASALAMGLTGSAAVLKPLGKPASKLTAKFVSTLPEKAQLKVIKAGHWMKDFFLNRPMGPKGRDYYASKQAEEIQLGLGASEVADVAESISRLTNGRKDKEVIAFWNMLGYIPGVKCKIAKNPKAVTEAEKVLKAIQGKLTNVPNEAVGNIHRFLQSKPVGAGTAWDAVSKSAKMKLIKNEARHLHKGYQPELKAAMDNLLKVRYDLADVKIPMNSDGLKMLEEYIGVLRSRGDDATNVAFNILKSQKLRGVEQAKGRLLKWENLKKWYGSTTAKNKRGQAITQMERLARAEVKIREARYLAKKGKPYTAGQRQGQVTKKINKKIAQINKEMVSSGKTVTKYDKLTDKVLTTRAVKTGTKIRVDSAVERSVAQDQYNLLKKISEDPKYDDILKAGKVTREYQDILSQRLLESEIPSDRVRTIIDESMGDYVRQLYLKKNPMVIIGGKERLQLGMLKRRKYDIFDARDYLAMKELELVDYATANIVVTGNEINRAIAISKHFDRVVSNKRFALQDKLVKRIASKYKNDAVGFLEKAGYRQLPSSNALGSLKGKWVHHSIHADLMDMTILQSKSTNHYLMIAKFAQEGMKLWKMGKVVFAPPAHFRNLVSNSLLLDCAGINHFQQIVFSKSTLTGMLRKDELYKLALENMTSLHGRSQLIQEFSSKLINSNQLDDIIKYVEQDGQWAAADIARHIFKQPMKLYEFEEQFFKHMAFRWAILKKGMTAKQAGAFAEKYVFNYGDIPRVMGFARNTVVPFGTFTYKALPVLMETAVNRPLILYKWYAALNGLNNAAAVSMGIPKEEVKKLQARMPPYLRPLLGVLPQQIMLPARDKYGDLKWVNTSYYLPVGMAPEIINRGIARGLISSPYLSAYERFGGIGWLGEEFTPPEYLTPEGKRKAVSAKFTFAEFGKDLAPTMIGTNLAKLYKEYGGDRGDWRGRTRGSGDFTRDLLNPNPEDNVFAGIPILEDLPIGKMPVISDMFFGIKQFSLNQSEVNRNYATKLIKRVNVLKSRLRSIGIKENGIVKDYKRQLEKEMITQDRYDEDLAKTRQHYEAQRKIVRRAIAETTKMLREHPPAKIPKVKKRSTKDYFTEEIAGEK